MNRYFRFFSSRLFPPKPIRREGSVVPLPKPRLEGAKTLLAALEERKSTREFSTENIPLQTLSNLLWAGFGVNRPGEMKRTAPSAKNWQEIDIYIASVDGVFLFDAAGHTVVKLSGRDIREATGTQSFLGTAPVNFVYVADLSKLADASEWERDFYPVIDAGFIAENIHLYCATEGLATVVRGRVDRSLLSRIMNLRPFQKIIICQTIGYPKR